MSGIFGTHPEDQYRERELNRYLDSTDGSAIETRADKLREEYLDDADQVFDVLISEEWAGDVSSVVRAMINAHLLGNQKSWECFAKSLTQSIVDGVDKKAQFYAERDM